MLERPKNYFLWKVHVTYPQHFKQNELKQKKLKAFLKKSVLFITFITFITFVLILMLI